ncbi:hypothetical protein LB503_008028 [Fusarium chuoi]|nr:hypothetical protein LB503_008028 [Fusarium chuoi]
MRRYGTTKPSNYQRRELGWISIENFLGRSLLKVVREFDTQCTPRMRQHQDFWHSLQEGTTPATCLSYWYWASQHASTLLSMVR